MLARDYAYAWRTLKNSPVFAITAIVTVALGIGASTTIFSVTNAVLLRPLPYRDAERLVFACSDMRKRNVKDFPLSNADFIDLRNGAGSAFEDFTAVFTGRGVFPAEDGSLEQVRLGIVTTNFFRFMGANIVAGRDFQDSDGEPQPPAPPPGATAAAAPPRLPQMAILSYEYWQRRFGRSTAVLGRRLTNANGQPGPIIVGVLAPGFELLFPPHANLERVPDMWLANRLPYDTANRNQVSLRAIGRLKPGVSL